MLLLTALACGPAQPTNESGRAADPAGDDSSTEAASGSTVTTQHQDVELDSDEVTVDTPAHATLLLLETCYGEGSEHHCQPWKGTYRRYDNGDLVLVPYATDLDVARITWLVIK